MLAVRRFVKANPCNRRFQAVESGCWPIFFPFIWESEGGEPGGGGCLRAESAPPGCAGSCTRTLPLVLLPRQSPHRGQTLAVLCCWCPLRVRKLPDIFLAAPRAGVPVSGARRVGFVPARSVLLLQTRAMQAPWRAVTGSEGSAPRLVFCS